MSTTQFTKPLAGGAYTTTASVLIIVSVQTFSKRKLPCKHIYAAALASKISFPFTSADYEAARNRGWKLYLNSPRAPNQALQRVLIPPPSPRLIPSPHDGEVVRGSGRGEFTIARQFDGTSRSPCSCLAGRGSKRLQRWWCTKMRLQRSAAPLSARQWWVIGSSHFRSTGALGRRSLSLFVDHSNA